jgi:DNA-binding transcriptional MocR family regulator
VNRGPVPATLERRIHLVRTRLAAGGDIARAVLRDLFAEAIWLRPDSGGRHLWAEFSDAGIVDLLYDSDEERSAAIAAMFPLVESEKSAIMVAGAGFL